MIHEEKNLTPRRQDATLKGKVVSGGDPISLCAFASSRKHFLNDVLLR